MGYFENNVHIVLSASTELSFSTYRIQYVMMIQVLFVYDCAGALKRSIPQNVWEQREKAMFHTVRTECISPWCSISKSKES